jgi:hypothetical protein
MSHAAGSRGQLAVLKAGGQGKLKQAAVPKSNSKAPSDPTSSERLDHDDALTVLAESSSGIRSPSASTKPAAKAQSPAAPASSTRSRAAPASSTECVDVGAPPSDSPKTTPKKRKKGSAADDDGGSQQAGEEPLPKKSKAVTVEEQTLAAGPASATPASSQVRSLADDSAKFGLLNEIASQSKLQIPADNGWLADVRGYLFGLSLKEIKVQLAPYQKITVLRILEVCLLSVHLHVVLEVGERGEQSDPSDQYVERCIQCCVKGGDLLRRRIQDSLPLAEKWHLDLAIYLYRAMLEDGFDEVRLMFTCVRLEVLICIYDDRSSQSFIICVRRCWGDSARFRLIHCLSSVGGHACWSSRGSAPLSQKRLH